MSHIRTKVGALLCLFVVVLGACGSSKAAVDSHNAADVTFTQGMIPHHEQAIDMANLVLADGADAKVKDLAQRIKAAQDPEVKLMKGWLSTWGEKEMAMDGSMAGHSMNGMVSGDEMKALGGLKGADLDKRFVALMIAHHDGAIEMANTQLKNGKSAAVKTLANAVVKAQQAEIDEMKKLS